MKQILRVFCIAAFAAPFAGAEEAITIIPPANQRSIVGSSDDRTFDATVSSTFLEDQDILVSTDMGTVVNPPVIVPATDSVTAVVRPDYGALTVGNPQTVTITTAHANEEPAWSSVSESFDVQGIQNRQLTGTFNPATLTGRNMVGTQIGTITLDGGNFTSDQATTVQVHGGNAFARHANGLRLTASDTEGFIFDDANQTYTLNVSVVTPGAFDIQNFQLGTHTRQERDSGPTHVSYGGTEHVTATYSDPLKIEEWDYNSNLLSSSNNLSLVENQNRDPGAVTAYREVYTPGQTFGNNRPEFMDVVHQEELTRTRGNALMTSEDLPGSTIDLSEISITASGEFVQDRSVGNFGPNQEGFSSTVVHHLGRQMVATGTQTVYPGTQTVTILTLGSDDTRTRITLDAFENQMDNGITANHTGPVLFNEHGVETHVSVQGSGLVFDRSQAGLQTHTVDVGGFITGEGLDGENTQNVLKVGFGRTFVQDNSVQTQDVTLFTLEGMDLTQATFYNREARRTHVNISEYTDIQVDNSFTLSGTAPSAGNESTSAIFLDENKVTPEGLSGENPDFSKSYNVTVKSIRDVDFSSSPTNVVYGDGDQINFQNTDHETTQASVLFTGYQRNSDGPSPFVLNIGQGMIAPGDNVDADVIFVLPNSHGADTLGRKYSDAFTLHYESFYAESGNIARIGSPWARPSLLGAETETLTYEFFHEIATNASGTEGGTASFSAGESLRTSNVFYTFDDGDTETFGTTFRIIDSSTFAQSGSLTLNVSVFGDLPSEQQIALNAEKVHGQVFDLTGLDGILHVLEMSFDPDTLPYSPNGARVGWYDEEEDQWIHAIMGNSDVGSLTEEQYAIGKFFAGSYDSYLDSLEGAGPELGAFGVDSSGNVAWAVVDHNSSFAIIPEVSSLAMILIFFMSCGAVAKCRGKKTYETFRGSFFNH
ncbi:MAG: hypothetical protein LAT83_02170 [Kiritimatiellae bacterium]|nr:hypothetical protein [Kiritimatiellia bacterium]